ncbi:MAG: SH3 domain-containing protein [Clostridia bacterium]|jgi:uncharacterized protein YgiM (DUF1202 family)|nr:SH3 domain-containing protein [Clostridia bacterium]
MKLRGIIVLGAVLSLAIGFMVGKTVNADAPDPGSSQDPVVSKSYVDAAVEERIGELEAQVAELTVQAQALQTTINELQTKVTGSKSSSTTTTKPPATTTPSTGTPSGTSTTPSTGTTTPDASGTPAAGSAVGKTAYVKSTGNYVNLRSGPSIDTASVKQVQKNEAMRIFEEKDQWYHVELPDKTTGWVANWVVDVK